MIFCLFLLSFVNLVSSGWYENNNDGVIKHYFIYFIGATSDGWDYGYDITKYYGKYTFNENCCSNNEMVLLVDRNDAWSKYIFFSSSNMDMTSLKIINTNGNQQQLIDTENMKNDISFYFGCFSGSTYNYDDDSYTCRQIVNERTLINIEGNLMLPIGNQPILTPEQQFKVLNEVDSEFQNNVVYCSCVM
ncbi:hypothetical protein QTN25_002218 [Entamoeba marina]